MLIRRIEKKTSIDQGLKLLREAKELLSGSLSDNIVGLHMTSLKFKLKNRSILPGVYFHDALEQLKTNFHRNFRFKRVLGFVIEYA